MKTDKRIIRRDGGSIRLSVWPWAIRCREVRNEEMTAQQKKVVTDAP
jgi:hypothetical protein